MHARFEHALSLRDGEPVDVAVRAHVERCADCSALLGDATQVTARLRALPAVGAPPQAQWDAIRSALATRGRDSRRPRPAILAWGAAVALSAFACGLAWRVADAPVSDAAAFSRVVTALTAEEAIAADRVAQLQDQSAALEEALAALGIAPAVERAGMALPIDTLEAQVQWIDHRLSMSANDPREAEPLWRERVEAMHSLVRLRFVEAQRIAM